MAAHTLLRCLLFPAVTLLVGASCFVPAFGQTLNSPESDVANGPASTTALSAIALLNARCVECHGASKQEAGLRLDQRELLLSGGDNGRVAEPGLGHSSTLMQRVTSMNAEEQMPPDGPRLTAAEVQLLTDWIDQGVLWPESAVSKAPGSDHWAWQPLVALELPSIPAEFSGWIQNEIDVFVLSRLLQAGLQPAPEASRSTLIRRASLDLTGLLPTVEEVVAFEQDDSPEAWEKVIDRLLSSPHFGERWGRHWLDMARYADSDGYEKDNARPDAWRYRDWVIDAINQDMPFDQFTIEQLAGDLLPNPTPMQLLATAFHRQTLTNTEGGTDQEQFRVEACFDRTETTGTVWLGLTVGCARCHSHKYDPFSQREYYQLFAVFNNADETTRVVPKPQRDVEAWPAAKAAWDLQLEQQQTRLQTARQALQSDYMTWLSQQQRLVSGGKVDKSVPKEVIQALRIPAEQHSPGQQQTLLDFWSRQHESLKPLMTELDALRKAAPEPPELSVRVLTQRTKDPRITRVLRRGEFLQPRLDLEVQPASPAILPALSARNPAVPPDRLDFARWLVDLRNPLTPRVTVNHFWARLFGRGLVRTVADFGVRGDPPSHPELLDWLAARWIGLSASPVVESGETGKPSVAWSRKKLLRLILTSATWRQSSVQRADFQEQDPANTLLWRQNRLRVEAEIVRDISLQVAGLLSGKIGGPSVFPPLPAGVAELSYAGNFRWTESTGEDRFRRGMYTFFKRTAPHPSLTTFDCPDANLTCAERSVSNTPLQALVTLNNDVFAECARQFAVRLLQSKPESETAAVERAFLWCLGRRSAPDEVREVLQLLHESQRYYQEHPEVAEQLLRSLTAESSDTERSTSATTAAWINVCRLLLNLDEFITRE